MADIEYFTPPLIEEILRQQRMILEMQKELLKALAQPSFVYHGEESKSKSPK